jgi:hypothetical protein
MHPYPVQGFLAGFRDSVGHCLTYYHEVKCLIIKGLLDFRAMNGSSIGGTNGHKGHAKRLGLA